MSDGIKGSELTVQENIQTGDLLFGLKKGEGTSFTTGLFSPEVLKIRHGVDTQPYTEKLASISALEIVGGDLIYATASNAWAKLAKGTARQALAMNSGATAPEWVASIQSIMTTQGDLIYASAANTPVRLAKGTARQALAMNSGATAPEWVASIQSILTTQGDLIYASAANTPVRLAKGTARQALAMNSGATAPEWVASMQSLLTTQGDIIYASAANTPARLAKNTNATMYLSNTGTSNNPAWAKVNLTNGVSGNLPVANGGTGLDSITAGHIPFGKDGNALETSSFLFFDSAVNRLGLGTAQPVKTLEIVAGSAGSESLNCQLRSHNTTTNSGVGIKMVVSTTPSYTGGVEIVAVRTNASVAGDHDLVIKVSNGTTIAEALRIKHNKDLECKGNIIAYA